MKILRYTSHVLALAFALGAFIEPSLAQNVNQMTRGRIEVNRSVEEIEITASSMKRLKFGYDIPDIHVENDSVIRVRPVAADQILVTGLKPGVTAITVSDPDGNLQHVQIQVVADTRELQQTLRRVFPASNVKAVPMKQGVMLTGTVGNPDDVNPIMELAADYFPTRVINRMVIDGSQMVAIEVKVYEVSRTKLRQLGVDWAVVTSDFNIGSSIAGVISQLSANPGTLPTAGSANVTFGVLSNGDQFQAFIDTLEQRDVAKLMDQPTLVAINGRAAEFLSGGEIPIQVASGLGTNSVEFRPFGTKLDLVPKILEGGRVRLEIRAEVSEVANDLSQGTGVPGFRVRRVNTAVAMNAGHTLALAGDYREETETQNRGLPWLMNLPGAGLAFRRVQDTQQETELVFLIKPRFISDVPDEQLPMHRPGRMTVSPSNSELYLKGYVEVPKCNEDCPTSQFNPQSNLQQWQGNIHNRSQHQLSDQYQRAPANSQGSQAPVQKSGFGYPRQPTYSVGDQNKTSYSLPRYRNSRPNAFNWNNRQASQATYPRRRY